MKPMKPLKPLKPMKPMREQGWKARRTTTWIWMAAMVTAASIVTIGWVHNPDWWRSEPPALSASDSMFDAAMILYFQEHHPELGTPPRGFLDGLRGFSHQSCDALDAGLSVDQVLRRVAEAGDEMPMFAMAHALGAGVATYCPQHSGKVS